jgi:hypothetical protein
MLFLESAEYTINFPLQSGIGKKLQKVQDEKFFAASAAASIVPLDSYAT